MQLQRALYSMIIASILCACGAPLFRTDNFTPDTELISDLEPYLQKWATLPPEQTLDERKELESQLPGILLIDVTFPRTDVDGGLSYAVDVRVDVLADWTKGYYYVPQGYPTDFLSSARVRQLSEQLYIYNRNE